MVARRRKCKPTIYRLDDTCNMVLIQLGQKPQLKFIEDRPATSADVEGHIPYPVDAVVTNPDTKLELVKWKQPMFFVWESSSDV